MQKNEEKVCIEIEHRPFRMGHQDFLPFLFALNPTTAQRVEFFDTHIRRASISAQLDKVHTSVRGSSAIVARVQSGCFCLSNIGVELSGVKVVSRAVLVLKITHFIFVTFLHPRVQG